MVEVIGNSIVKFNGQVGEEHFDFQILSASTVEEEWRVVEPKCSVECEWAWMNSTKL